MDDRLYSVVYIGSHRVSSKAFRVVRGGNVIDNRDCIDNQHSKFSFSDHDSTPKSLNFCRGGSEKIQ